MKADSTPCPNLRNPVDTMDNPRFFLYAALALVLFMMWQAWQKDYAALDRPEPTQTVEQDQVARAQDLPALPETPAEVSASAPRPAAEAVSRATRVRVETDVMSIELDTRGGDIRVLDLLDYPLEKGKPQPYPLLSDTLPAFFIAQGGLLSNDDNAPTHHAEWRAERASYRLADGADELRVPLAFEDGTGLRVVKTYVFTRGDYEVVVEHRVENGRATPWQGAQYLQLQRTEAMPVKPSWFIPTYLGAAVHDGAKYRKIEFEDLVSQPLSADFSGGWAAMVQHYFIAAAIPPRDAVNHFYATTLDAGRYLVGTRTPAVAVEPGGTVTLASRLYLGPKLQDRLAEIAPGLARTVDYGWLTFIAEPLFWLLEKIHSFVKNWGVAIILLTVLVKLAFFKLSETSYRSMARMRKVQPRMKALQERYKDDRQRLNQAMMDLYKTEKINPLGGCLPILVQVPVFIALYWVLLESVELRQAPFMLWIQDLSAKDPYFVLPALMGASMYLQQKLNPAPTDPVQAKVMSFLPIVFTVFFAFFPSGLVLYWLVNNLISLSQQAYITRKLEATGR